MNPFKQFIQKIIDDLRLGELTPSLKKTLTLQVGKIVDKQIESAVNSSFTTEDWDTFNGYLQSHPEAPQSEAFKVVIEKRPELEETFENAFVQSYDEIMKVGSAATLVVNNVSEEKTES